MTGRPPVIQRDYVDCKFPTPQTPMDEEEGEERESACESRCSLTSSTCTLVAYQTTDPQSRIGAFDLR